MTLEGAAEIAEAINGLTGMILICTLLLLFFKD